MHLSTERTGIFGLMRSSSYWARKASAIVANSPRPISAPFSTSTVLPSGPVMSTGAQRPTRLSLGSPASLNASSSMYSSVPQSGSRMITSCDTSTRRRVR